MAVAAQCDDVLIVGATLGLYYGAINALIGLIWAAAALQPLPAPPADLSEVNPKLLSDLGDRLVVFHRIQGHFGLECG